MFRGGERAKSLLIFIKEEKRTRWAKVGKKVKTKGRVRFRNGKKVKSATNVSRRSYAHRELTAILPIT